jgi:putative transposase
MADYRRANVPGATYFFTVNCAERRGNRLLTDHVDALRQTFRQVKVDHPFTIEAMVVLPEHLHCLWPLPPGDGDFKTRWGLIKAGFSRALPPGEPRKTGRAGHLATAVLGASDPGCAGFRAR